MYDEAEKLFNSIDIKDYYVSEIRILNYIGLCYLRKKPADVDKAYEAFMKGFKVDAKEPAIHENIYLCAVMFYQNEKYEKAIKSFKFCIENGYIKSSYYFLGVIYNDQDKNKEALSYFEKALALDPKNENIIKAIKLVKKVIKVDNSFLGKLFGGN